MCLQSTSLCYHLNSTRWREENGWHRTPPDGSEHAALSFQLNVWLVRVQAKSTQLRGWTGGSLLPRREQGGSAVDESGGNWAAQRLRSCSPRWLPLPGLYGSACSHKALLFATEKLPGERWTGSRPYSFGNHRRSLSHPHTPVQTGIPRVLLTGNRRHH